MNYLSNSTGHYNPLQGLMQMLTEHLALQAWQVLQPEQHPKRLKSLLH